MFADARPTSVSRRRQNRVELARTESGRPEFEAAVLKKVVAKAARKIPGAQCAGLTLITHGRQITTLTSTDHYPVLLDEIQQRHLEGPSLTVAWLQDTVRVDDLAEEGRWPDYQREALLRTPIRSVLSFRLFTSEDTLGVLSVYSACVNVFDDVSEDVGLTFAAQAARAWQNAHRNGQLRSALLDCDVVEQAKHILMERFSINASRALELLQCLSRDENMPLARMARHLAQQWFDATTE
jgi:GAF domain-containing protein